MIRNWVFFYGFIEREGRAETFPAREEYLPPLNFNCESDGMLFAPTSVIIDGNCRYQYWRHLFRT